MSNRTCRQRTCFLVLALATFWILVPGSARALDRLYITGTVSDPNDPNLPGDPGNGALNHLLILNGLPVGNCSLAAPCDTTTLSDSPLNNAHAGPLDVSETGEVLVGGDVLQIFNANGVFETQSGPLNGDPNNPVRATAVEIGSLGSGYGIVATHDQVTSTQVLFWNYDPNDPCVFTAGNPAVPSPIPDGGKRAAAVEFGNMTNHALAPGNEVLVAVYDPNLPDGGAAMGPVWVAAWNGTSTLVFGQHATNHTISDLATGELTGPGLDEYVTTGQQPLDPNVPQLFPGQGTQAFQGVSSDIWNNGLAGPHGDPNAGLVMKAVVIDDVFDAGIDPDGGNEVIVVGNNVLRIFNNVEMDPNGINNAPLQETVLNQDAVDVVVADVLRDDGIDEIVIISSDGIIVALEQDPNTSLYVADPSQGIGAAFDTGRVLYKMDTLPVVAPNEEADFNGDGFRNGLDLLIWQRGFNTGLLPSEGDANGDGMVDEEDLQIWRKQYGTTSSVASVAAVPEPTSLGLWALAGVVLLAGRKSLPYRD